MNAKTTVSSPGRICLFGEHQDYLGLPVVAAAINLRARLEAEPWDRPVFEIIMPDIGKTELVDLTNPIEYERPRDYFKSGVRVMQKQGVQFNSGAKITLTSGIPVAKGCSGSSAILVAWIGLLDRLSGSGVRLSPAEIASLAYQAEVKEFNEPGGMMDHFSSALGGVVHIETKGSFAANPLPAPHGAFVLGDSLEPKDTTGVLARVKANVTAGINYLKEKDPAFDIETAAVVETNVKLRSDISEEARRAVMANLANRDITKLALALFNRCGASGSELGTLLNSHHANLRDGLGISTPKIEEMIIAARRAGAAGCKINGSGGGGCMIAYCHDPHAVAAAIEEAGGAAHIIEIDRGFLEE